MKRPLKPNEVTYIIKRDYKNMTEEEILEAYEERWRSICAKNKRNNRETEKGQKDK